MRQTLWQVFSGNCLICSCLVLLYTGWGVPHPQCLSLKWGREGGQDPPVPGCRERRYRYPGSTEHPPGAAGRLKEMLSSRSGAQEVPSPCSLLFYHLRTLRGGERLNNAQSWSPNLGKAKLHTVLLPFPPLKDGAEWTPNQLCYSKWNLDSLKLKNKIHL